MVDGFRVERLLGAGPVGAVYEATQVSLGRAVALRLIGGGHFADPASLERFEERQRALASLHHPNLVATYAVGEWEGGRYVATRHIRGTTLASLLEQGLAPHQSAIESLTAALEAAHSAGLVHGHLTAESILVESNGACYLSGVGLRESADPQKDLEALSSLIEAARSTAAPTVKRRRTRRLALAGLGGAALVAVVALLAAGSGGEEVTPVPPPAPGTEAIGSSLAGASTMVGCSDILSPNTPGCTLMQARLPGRQLIVPEAGVIRSWSVREGAGVVSLQVIRLDSKERGFVAGFAQPESLSGEGPHQFEADVGVKAGDRIGIHLDPGAFIGARAGVDAAHVTKWDGVLTAEARQSDGEISESELMLRADIEYGAEPAAPDQLVGRAAARAPRGKILSAVAMTLPVRNGVRVIVAEVDGVIVIDVFGRKRLSRIEVPDANVEGQLVDVSQECGPAAPGGFCVRWTNPGLPFPLEHQYVVRRDGHMRFVG